MSDFDELDSLLGPLREPATPAELASEREMVDLMAKNHRHAKGTIMFSSRRARVATLIAAGVIGFGGVAAAGGGGLGLNDSDSRPTLTPEVEEVEVEEVEEIEEVDEVEVEITTTTAADVVVENEDDDDTSADEVAKATQVVEEEATEDMGAPDPKTEFDACIPEANHGKTVSAVAHGMIEGEVRDAARSDCGKTVDAVADVDETEGADVQDSEDVDTDEDVDIDEDDESTSTRQTPPGRESNNGRGNGNHGKPGDDD